MKKLHTYQDTCLHYSPKPGGIYACDKGVTIRDHVGGSDFGWMARMPCVTTGLSKEQVPCNLRELPTAEQVKADQATMEAHVRAIINGSCPECGKVLRLRETDEVQLQECPDGHVSMRGCKRMSDVREGMVLR